MSYSSKHTANYPHLFTPEGELKPATPDTVCQVVDMLADTVITTATVVLRHASQLDEHEEDLTTLFESVNGMLPMVAVAGAVAIDAGNLKTEDDVTDLFERLLEKHGEVSKLSKLS